MYTVVLGVVASELPPERGGMQEHARGLLERLALRHRVRVFTSELAGAGEPRLSWEAGPDRRLLRAQSVDAWLTLNAGLAGHCRGLGRPAFAFVHGNDLLRPWQPAPSLGLRCAARAGRMLGTGDPVERWRRRRMRAGLRAADAVFANSRFTRDLCRDRCGVASERIAVVPPGIDQRFFERRPRRSSSRLRLVTVARLQAHSRRKNIDGVLEAVALLRGEPDVMWRVIGSGDDRPRLEAAAASLGVCERVEFLGDADQGRVLDVFADSDVFVMAVQPSATDVEGFGMAYAEAAAAGLPSIATALGGIPDAVQDGVTGRLIDDASADAIAEAIRRFARERALYDPERIRAFALTLSAEASSEKVADAIEARLGQASICSSRYPWTNSRARSVA